VTWGAFGPWEVVALGTFWSMLMDAADVPRTRPAVVALDGRSSSGKTTLAVRLEDAISGVWAVHTDDLAWWHSYFGWSDLLIQGVLRPVHQGRPVAFRPPAWEERGRSGAIEVPGECGRSCDRGCGCRPARGV
jgi:hypothetical protein